MEGKHTPDEYIAPDDNFQPRAGTDWAVICAWLGYLLAIAVVARACYLR